MSRSCGGDETLGKVRFWLLLLAAGCGRIGFDARAIGGDASGGGDVANGDSTAATVWSHLIAYADQTCARRGDLAYCWGANGSGQLGDGTKTNAPTPVQVALPAGTLIDLAMGETHGAAIVDGVIYGFGDIDGAPAPTAVTTSSTGPLPPATSVTCGREFTCAIASSVYCWGPANGTGQLGVGDTNPRAMPTAAAISSVTAIHAGDDHACARLASGAMCWGHSDYGTLGTGSNTPASSSTPLAVTGGITALPVIAGWHACALQSGNVFCWGEGDNGELGNGGTSSTPTPTQVPSLSSISAIAVGGGPTDRDASCAITAGGAVYCWGNGLYGRLGQGTANPSTTPIAVAGLPPGVAATQLAIGYDHACALLADGSLWCWGRGDSGQLGDGKMMSSLAPVQVLMP